MLSRPDIEQINSHGLSLAEVDRQINLLQKGIEKINLDRPATIHDGILSPDSKVLLNWSVAFKEQKSRFSISKFVPASGAATRMFHDLITFSKTKIHNSNSKKFQDNLSRFPFVNTYFNLENEKFNDDDFLSVLLSEKGVQLFSKPKAFLEFHCRNKEKFTPLDSHIYEAMHYSNSISGDLNLHFTFSKEHLIEGIARLNKIKIDLKEKFGINSVFNCSVQDPSTDTIALDENNHLLRNQENKIVFRPGGHGALLNNLNATKSDLVFIQNIDNVLPPHRNTETVFYKNVLGGCLLDFRSRLISIFGNENNESQKKESLKLICQEFQIPIPVLFNSLSISQLKTYFNKPIRVCGMVKNEGQPGGGPFWVKNSKDELSLQIVEANQISSNSDQQTILNSSSHFNPVDLLCCLVDLDNQRFNLFDFVDENTSFISEKYIDGKKIKILERPGLWNGSMANWITIFIEMPISLFNPVKSVTDLLNENHQK